MKFNDIDNISTVNFISRSVPGEVSQPSVLIYQVGCNRPHIIWGEALQALEGPPYPTGPHDLVVGYRIVSDLTCHLALGWPLPEALIDLLVEFRNQTNGLVPVDECTLPRVLELSGLDGYQSSEGGIQQLIDGGENLTLHERKAIVAYGFRRLHAIRCLFSGIANSLDFDTALFRGHYLNAVAQIEQIGVPIDVEAWRKLQRHWDGVKLELIRRVDPNFQVYEGTTFKMDRFAHYLEQNQINDWPRTSTGRLQLKQETLAAMAKRYPELEPLHRLRADLGKVRTLDLVVGRDGRNRSSLHPFQSITGRNQPSSTQSVFNVATFLRHLIRPGPSMGLGYIDWSQQEFGIAASLSEDPLMLQAYESGDPYLGLAKQAGAVPEGATKATHRREREQFKECAIAILYGSGAHKLAKRIAQPEAVARDLLAEHRQRYSVFWNWVEETVDRAFSEGRLQTGLGWTLHVDRSFNALTLRNFPIQATGADMLRVACCLATEWGVRVCATAHDAILIEAPLEKLNEHVETARSAMAEASKFVLDGFELRTDVKVFPYPERYRDDRGTKTWERIWRIVERLDGGS